MTEEEAFTTTRMLLLLVSATHKFPTLSTATPHGAVKRSVLTEPERLITWMLLPLWSAKYTIPSASTATPLRLPKAFEVYVLTKPEAVFTRRIQTFIYSTTYR